VEVLFQPGADLRIGATASMSDFEGFVQKYATLTYGFRPTYQNVNVPRARLSSVGLEGRWSPVERVQLKGALTFLEADNRTADDAVPAILDFFNTPTPYTYTVDRLPYLADRNASLAAQVRAGAGFTVGLTAQYTGSMWIQGFDDDPSTPGILGSETLEEFFETDAFWAFGARIDKQLPKGLSAYLGVDNLTDELQSDLGDPRRDYDWGLLRGRYWYAGLGWRHGDR
jgi:outer membrane receptor protein involved in Fe transport